MALGKGIGSLRNQLGTRSQSERRKEVGAHDTPCAESSLLHETPKMIPASSGLGKIMLSVQFVRVVTMKVSHAHPFKTVGFSVLSVTCCMALSTP